MRSPVKQKLSTLQTIINNAQTGGGGGGGTVDAYTKAESDAKFETQTNAAATYLSKSTAQSTYLAIADATLVPEPESTEDNYVLTADYGETPSYSWKPASGGGTQVQADWTESDTTDPSYIQNKPDLSDMATKTWVGNQGYLTSAREVPEVTLASQNGKVLTATYSGGVGSFDWETPASGGLAVETDGTNYWITVNSIRLYFASSAPTGTIPNGSLGLGW